MKEKLSLKSIKNVLSRDEMKKIMAGSGVHCTCPNGTGATQDCSTLTAQECVDMCVAFCNQH